jgi:hypothetical protein
MGPSDRSIQTFDPLLRDLITWGLVSSDGERWDLSERAQRRLSELAASSGPWPVEQTVYFGHRCAGCGTKALTRLREGVHVCDSCWDKREERNGVDHVVTPHRPRLLRRNVHIA